MLRAGSHTISLTLLAALACACGAADDDTDNIPAGSEQGNEGSEADAGPEEPEYLHGRIPCDLETQFDGDQYCILPPEPGEGAQLHLGPEDYDDPDDYSKFMLGAGEESTECYYTRATNEETVVFYEQFYRMRPGSHHLFVNITQNRDTEGWSGCRLGADNFLIGGAQSPNVDFPPGGLIPEEDKNLGRPLYARARIMFEAHFVNATTEPILREAWVNYMKVEDPENTRALGGVFMLGGLREEVAPGEHKTSNYWCENGIDIDRRVVSLFGHRHAHTTRFTAWAHRDGERTLVYDDHDWNEPAELIYNTVIQNPAPDPEVGLAGGYSGMLILKPGDRLEWECEIHNTSENTLRWGNEVYTGEMCNLFGSIAVDGGSPIWSCRPEMGIR